MIGLLRKFGKTEQDWFEYKKTHKVVGDAYNNCKVVSNEVLTNFAGYYILKKGEIKWELFLNLMKKHKIV